MIDENKLLKRIEEEYDLNYGQILINPIDFYDMVQDQIDDNNGWTLCSNKLPDKSGEYLVTYEWLHSYYTKYINFEKLKTKGKWKSKENIIAWKEKDKPYIPNKNEI